MNPSKKITLFGATGFTGQLIAYELDQRGLSFRIAGRSDEKLKFLSTQLTSRPEWVVADVTHPESLPTLFHDTNLLINCAGPFTDLGERVITQAAMSGVHYLDITNELGYVFKSRSYHEMAQRTGAALVPACGFEISLADCAAQIAGSIFKNNAQSEPFDSIDILYTLKGSGASQGTRKSMVRSLATSWIAFKDGDWTGQIPGQKVRQFQVNKKPRFAFSIPSCESITIPVHLPVYEVNTWMATSRNAHFWAPFLIPLLARLSRSVLRGAIIKIASHGGLTTEKDHKGSPEQNSTFSIDIWLRQKEREQHVSVSGQNPYALTAKIVAYAAEHMLQPDFRGSGFLAPAQALDPFKFFDYAQKNWDISFSTLPKIV